MTHSLYFTAAEGNVGTQALVRTFVTSLKERYTSVGVFRAFTNGPVDQDLPFKEALELVGRSEDLDLAWGATRQAYVANEEAAMADMVKRYTDYAEEFDAVLILGLLDGDPLQPRRPVPYRASSSQPFHHCLVRSIRFVAYPSSTRHSYFSLR